MRITYWTVSRVYLKVLEPYFNFIFNGEIYSLCKITVSQFFSQNSVVNII